MRVTVNHRKNTFSAVAVICFETSKCPQRLEQNNIDRWWSFGRRKLRC